MGENTLNRIKQYIDYKGITISSFEREAGMSNGSFASQLKKNKTIGVDKLENILTIFPDINTEWLLTGTGPMLKEVDKTSIGEPDEPYVNKSSKDELYERIIAEQKERILDLQRTIEDLRAQLDIKEHRKRDIPE